MNVDSREVPTEYNLLTNFDMTVELIKQVEGEAWYRSYLKDVSGIVERLKKHIQESSGVKVENLVFDSFYGDGGVSRWMVMQSGEVRFSGFHDQADKIKLEKVRALGFKIF